MEPPLKNLKNFGINIHQAMLQAIMHCNRQAAAAVAGRQASEKPRAAGACATNSAHGRGFAKIIL